MEIERVANTEELKDLLKGIFTDEFMVENTNFECFKAFQYSSAVFVNWDAEELIYNAENLDNFVKESTKFSKWDEMIQTATDKRFKK